MVATRNIVVLLLCITVVAPIVLYTDRLGTFKYPSGEFLFSFLHFSTH
jgi:alpha-1,4-galacturonosyltransferase